MSEALKLLNKTICNIGITAKMAIDSNGAQAVVPAAAIADACIAAVAKSQGLMAAAKS
jgi:hypothetical protein